MLRKSSVAVGVLALVLVMSAVVVAAAPKASKAASWTFLVYLDGDNNLDPDSVVDVAEMAAGAGPGVNVVVLWDRLDGPGYLFQVTSGSTQVVTGFALNGKELNMGSGDTLKAFVGFALGKYPASHVALDLWDHGDDFRGFAWDDHPNPDGSPGDDFLTHDEIIGALAGTHLDILAFDGCVMSNIEVAYEYAVRGLSIDFLVASEEYIPLQGFDYAAGLAAIVANPGMGAYDVAKALVDTYVASYGGGGWQVGLSVVEMSRVEALGSSLVNLGHVLAPNMEEIRDAVGTARGNAMLSSSMNGWEACIDLPTFVRSLDRTLGSDSRFGPAIDEVASQFDVVLPYVRNTHGLEVKGAGGMALFFPGAFGSFSNNMWWYGDYYLRMTFPHAGWLDFLMAYWGAA